MSENLAQLHPVARKPTVKLNAEEKGRIALAAFHLSQARDYKSLTPLLKDAAKEALGPDRQPMVNSATEDRWQWFRDKLAAYAKNPPAPEAQIAPPAPAPAPTVEEPDPGGEAEPEPAPEPVAAEPSPLTYAEQAAILDLNAVVPLDDAEADEREEWAMVVGMRRQRRKDRQLTTELDLLRKNIAVLTTAIQALRGEIAAIPEAMARAGERMVRASMVLQKPVITPMPEEERPILGIAKPGALNGRAVGLPTAGLAPPKVKVTVVGYTSGHHIKGCETEIAGRAVVRFLKADFGFPKYLDADYIVVTKEAPANWQAKAREIYPRDRLVFATGGAGDVGRKIATLPPPKSR